MKSLHRRMNRIARGLGADTQCRTCGYPDERSRHIIATSHDQPLEQCAQCDRFLDDSGIPLHQPFRRVIVLEANKNPDRHALSPSTR